MATDTRVVETTHGPVRGAEDGGIATWKSIRYAAPPIERWGGAADATSYGPACPQPAFPNMPIDLGAPLDEDCLRLNVWASANTGPGDAKPVLVWLHGGAYIPGFRSAPL